MNSVIPKQRRRGIIVASNVVGGEVFENWVARQCGGFTDGGGRKSAGDDEFCGLVHRVFK